MIISFSNLGGGGSYTLPTATATRLGGVKIGSGITVTNDGTISAEGGSYILPVATQNTLGGVMIGSGITVDSAGTISAQEYTLPTASSEVLGGIKVGSGLTITDGVLSANGGGGDSTALDEITELPESPVDDAVYNYNGLLIKYVDGPGEWGKWYGINATKSADSKDSKNTAILTYSVIPDSMDGELICVCHYFSSNYLYSYFDLQNDCINVYTDSASTATTAYVVNHNGGQVNMNLGFYSIYCEWENNTIRFTQSGNYALIDTPCDVTINTGHYELTSIPGSFINISDPTYGVIPVLNENGVVDGYAYTVAEGNVQINGSYKYFLGNGNKWNVWGSMYVPTESGAAGSLLVSQGNTAPVFKTIAQALGIDFWTGTQDEYDAITTKSSTTLYIIIPDE